MDLSIELPMSEQNFPIQEFFTDLVIIKTKDQKEKEKKEKEERNRELIERDSLLEALDRMTLDNESIEPNELFQKKDGGIAPKKVLVFGRAGVGKTTLIDKITSDWAEERGFTNFETVYRLPLRKLNVLRQLEGATDTSDWFAKAVCFGILRDESAIDGVREHFRNFKSSTLILLDGLDEASPEVRVRVEELLEERDLHLILTTRPGPHLVNKRSIDRQVENLGFSSKHIEEYVATFFQDGEEKKVFLDTLKKDANFYSLAHIPLQLQMLCAIWDPKVQKFPSTFTKLITMMVDELWKWNWTRQGLNPDSVSPKKKEALFDALGRVAERGLKEGKLIISKAQVEEKLLETDVENVLELTNTGLLKSSGDDCYFIHLTYQEYFIALRMSKNADEDLKRFVQKNGFKPQYVLVINFLVGLITENDTRMMRQTSAFLKMMREGLGDLSGIYQMELMLRCFVECDRKKISRQVNSAYLKYINSYSQAIDTYLSGNSNGDDVRVFDFIKYLDLDYMKGIFRKIESAFSSTNTMVFQRAAAACARVSRNQRIPENLIMNINNLLKNFDDHDLLQVAAYFLGKIGKRQPLPNVVFFTLLEVMFGVDGDIPQEAALHAIADCVESQRIPKNVLKKITIALENEDPCIKKQAATLLGEVGSKEPLPQETLDALFDVALNDQEEFVQESAANALGKSAKKESFQNLDLINLEIDPDTNKFSEGYGMLETIMQIGKNQPIPNDILFQLVEFLKTENEELGSCVLIALDEINKNFPLPKAALVQLSKILKNEKGDIQEIAIEAIGKIGGKRPLPEDIFLQLVEFLNSKKEDVQEIAIEAIGRIGRNRPLPKGIILRLMEFLKGEKEDLKYCAIEAFGRIGENYHLIEDILFQILEDLKNRKNGIEAVIEKAIARISRNYPFPKEFIFSLLKLLEIDDLMLSNVVLRLVPIIARRKLPKKSLNFLIKCLDSDYDTKFFAAEALLIIGSGEKLSKDVLVKAYDILKKPSWMVFLPWDLKYLVRELGIVKPIQFADFTWLLDSPDYDEGNVLSIIPRGHVAISTKNILYSVCTNPEEKVYRVLLRKCFIQGVPLYFNQTEHGLCLCSIESGKEVSHPITEEKRKQFLEWAIEHSPFGDLFIPTDE